MKVILTVQEICERGLWLQVCKQRNFNEWALKEGLIGYDEELMFTEQQIKQLGLGLYERYRD